MCAYRSNIQPRYCLILGITGSQSGRCLKTPWADLNKNRHAVTERAERRWECRLGRQLPWFWNKLEIPTGASVPVNCSPQLQSKINHILLNSCFLHRHVLSIVDSFVFLFSESCLFSIFVIYNNNFAIKTIYIITNAFFQAVNVHGKVLHPTSRWHCRYASSVTLAKHSQH